MGLAAAIKATLGLDTKPLTRGLADADRATQTFAKRFKSALSGLPTALGGGAIAAAIKNSILGIREMSAEVKLSEEAMKSFQRAASGLTDEQAQTVSDMAANYDAAGAAAQGFFAKVVLGVKSVAGGKSFFKPFGERGVLESLKEIIAPSGEGPGNQTLGLTPAELKQIADAKRKAVEEEKKLRESVAKIDDDIVDKQQRAAEERMGIAGKIAETERKITEAKAGQVGQTDELVAAELRRKQAVEEIILEEQKRQQREGKIDEKLKGADQRRQEKRDLDKRDRTGRTIDATERSAEATRRKNGPQLLPRGPGELLGPPAPPKADAKLATTGDKIVTILGTIANNLGVKV